MRQYPNGKISPDDEGQLTIMVSSVGASASVKVTFPKPVNWFALPAELARTLAASLLHHADLAEDGMRQLQEQAKTAAEEGRLQ